MILKSLRAFQNHFFTGGAAAESVISNKKGLLHKNVQQPYKCGLG